MNKKGQVYIIASLIIIFVIIGLAGVSNYVTVKKEPQKFYDIGQVLKMEGIQVVANTNFNPQSNLNQNIGTYLDLFANYTRENINEDFNMIVIYGDSSSGNVSATIYSRASTGGVSIYFGGETAPFELLGSGQIKKDQRQVLVNQVEKTVDVTLSSDAGNITQTLPILSDNNFMFVMTTSSGFNQYIQSSPEPE